jgi:hypothetical protein
LLELEAWREKDTNAAVGKFIILFRKYGLRANQIWGDGGGVGHAMCDMLDAAGWSINRFDFGAKAHNEALYVSRGAELWDQLAMRVKKGEVVLINDPTLISQLSTRRMLYDARGRIKMQDKEDMRKEGLKSPDRADAVIGAFAHGVQSFAQYARRVDDPFEELDRYYEGLPKDDFSRDSSAEAIQKELGGWVGE